MWQVGLGIAIVGGYLWLSSKENSARKSYYRASERLSRETKERQRDIECVMRNNEYSRDFEKHIVLYKASVQSANACFKTYEQQKQLVKTCQSRLQEFGNRIGELKKQRDELKTRKAKGDKSAVAPLKAIYDELQQTRDFFTQVKEELATLRKVKKSLLTDVRELNKSTHKFKLYIRDNCGRGGRIWYERRFISN